MRISPMRGLLTSSMMTPAERAKGRFMRAPDHGDGGKALTQADIDAAVEKALAPLRDSLEKAESKNAGLLDDLKKAQREARAAKDIKPEDLAAAEDRADKAEAALADAQKAIKTAATEREKVAKALETEQGFTQKLLIQDGLTTALIANGVKDEDYIEMAVAKFAPNVTVKIDGDTRTASIGDKLLADAIKEWAASDAGKKVVAAPANGGGGAPGGRGNSAAKTMSSAELAALQPKARAEFMASGGALSD